MIIFKVVFDILGEDGSDINICSFTLIRVLLSMTMSVGLATFGLGILKKAELSTTVIS